MSLTHDVARPPFDSPARYCRADWHHPCLFSIQRCFAARSEWQLLTACSQPAVCRHWPHRMRFARLRLIAFSQASFKRCGLLAGRTAHAFPRPRRKVLGINDFCSSALAQLIFDDAFPWVNASSSLDPVARLNRLQTGPVLGFGESAYHACMIPRHHGPRTGQHHWPNA